MLIRAVRQGAIAVLVLALLVPTTFPQSSFAAKSRPVRPPTPPPGSAAISSRASGNWSNASTWSCSCVPGVSHVATILAGHEVTVDTVAAAAKKVIVDGTLKASRAVSSTLTLSGNLIVQGSGVLDYGTPTSRIPASVVAWIRFSLNEANYVGGHTMEPIDSDVGLWVVDSAKLYTAGPVRDAWSLMTTSAPVGSTQVSVDSQFATGWRPGDFILVGPSNAVVGPVQTFAGELRMIASNPSGGTFAFSTPLTNNHTVETVQWTDAWGEAQTDRLAPPVANLTRNIVFDAVNPAHRAHLMVMDNAVVQIEDLAVVNFSPVPKSLGSFANGRPKPMARYAVHFHGQKDASRSSYVRRAVVAGGMGHGLVIHDSYGVVVEDIVLYSQAKALGVSGTATYPIYLEGSLATDGSLIPDTGANQAWIDRPLILAWGLPESLRASGVWAEAGVAAYVVGIHCAGGQGKTTSCMHWHNNFGTDNDSASTWPVVQERKPRLLRGTAHSMPAGFSTWQNPGPSQDMVDLLVWNNADGLSLGAYKTNRRYFALRAIGNTQSQIKYWTLDMNVVGFLADGLNRGGAGITISDHSIAPTADALFDMGVVRRVNTAVTFAACLQSVSSPCGSFRSYVQFSRTTFDGDPDVKFVWHPSNETRLRFRNQTGLLRPVNFTLYRKDQTGTGGAYDAEYEAIRLSNDTAAAVSKPPMANMVSGGSFPGCAVDSAVVSGLATVCVETDAPIVEFWAGGVKIATVGAAGLMAQAIFNMSTWPYSRAYVYAKAIGSDGRYNISRVIQIRKPSGISASASQP